MNRSKMLIDWYVDLIDVSRHWHKTAMGLMIDHLYITYVCASLHKCMLIWINPNLKGVNFN